MNTHDGRSLYAGLPARFTAIRYHSLVASPAGLPIAWRSPRPPRTAPSWGLRHRGCCGAAPLEGVQFHPESVLTEHGHALLANFLHM
jgi:anthranilate/para-aminobenzoate synthase component II